jgi:hypothetical protein
LSLHGNSEDQTLAVDALQALDLNSKTVAINTQQLFQLIHQLTQTGDPRLLNLMQRLYIEDDVTVWGGNIVHPLMDIKGAMLVAMT